MKKLFASMAIATVVASSGIPASAEVAGGAGQSAFADWLVRDGRNYTMYFAMVDRFPSEEGLTTIAVAGRGACKRFDEKDFTLVICSGRGRGRSLPLDAFAMDPLMSSAHLSFTQRGHKQKVDWVGQGSLPVAGAGVFAGDFGAAAGIGSERFARPSGKLFGRKLKAKGMAFGDLATSAWAGAFMPEAEEIIRVHKTYRIPN